MIGRIQTVQFLDLETQLKHRVVSGYATQLD